MSQVGLRKKTHSAVLTCRTVSAVNVMLKVVPGRQGREVAAQLKIAACPRQVMARPSRGGALIAGAFFRRKAPDIQRRIAAGRRK